MIYTEKIFTSEECDKIIFYAKEKNIFNESIVNLNDSGQKIYDGNRMVGGKETSYYIHHFLNTKETNWVIDRLYNWFTIKTKINLKRLEYPAYPKELMVLNYQMGDKFERHVDISKGFEYRRWNLGIQLNDDYDGGEYICYDNQNKEIILPKERGTAIIYHISIPHEIKEIKSGNRWSLVSSIPEDFINEKKSFI